MIMDVKHRLTTILTVVHYEPEPVGYSFLLCDAPCRVDQMPDDSFVLFLHLRDIDDVLLGDDQHMRRGSGVDVTKCEDLIVLIDFRRWNLASDNFAEDTVINH